jgi:nucleotide-binding universal stress UspA family protein
MRTVLTAFDGSKEAETVVRRLAREAQAGEISEIHLLNVQPAFGKYVSQHVGARTIRDFQREQGQTALAAARRILDLAGVYHRTHVRGGELASLLVRTAHELRVDEIALSASGGGVLGNLLQYLLIARVIRRAKVPVVILSGPPRGYDVDLALGRPNPLSH